MNVFLSKVTGLALIVLLANTYKVEAVGNTLDFHRLLVTKAHLEKKFGIETLECFPFIENIGFTDDQKPLIHKCLNSAKILEQALIENPISDIRTVGISNRFMWVGGFNSLLIPWRAGKEEIKQFLLFYSRSCLRSRVKKQSTMSKKKLHTQR